MCRNYMYEEWDSSKTGSCNAVGANSDTAADNDYIRSHNINTIDSDSVDSDNNSVDSDMDNCR